MQGRYPGVDGFAHDAGHLLEMLFGWKSNPQFGPFHLLSFVLLGGGFWLLAAAWKVLYAAQRRHTLATTGPYAHIRHPQYVGFVLILLGFLVPWPTPLTLAMFPVLVFMYVRLARGAGGRAGIRRCLSPLRGASDAIRALMDLTPPMATVIRGGRELEAPTSEVVAGDTVLIGPGDKIPVDGQIIEASIEARNRAIGKPRGNGAKGGTYDCSPTAMGSTARRSRMPPPLGSAANKGVEMLHKILNGQPGEAMPALHALDPQIAADIAVHLQTLPKRPLGRTQWCAGRRRWQALPRPSARYSMGVLLIVGAVGGVMILGVFTRSWNTATARSSAFRVTKCATSFSGNSSRRCTGRPRAACARSAPTAMYPRNGGPRPWRRIQASYKDLPNELFDTISAPEKPEARCAPRARPPSTAARALPTGCGRAMIGPERRGPAREIKKRGYMSVNRGLAGRAAWCDAALAAALFAMTVYAQPARGAHPLITEDTATQGRGRLQLELQAELGKDKEQGVETDSADYAAVLTYGVRDNLDVLLSLPYTRRTTRADGTDTSVSGGGDVGVDAKWRFFEKDDFSVALKAGVTYPSGDGTQALGAGHWNYSVNLVTSYANGPWGYHLHFGYASNRNELDERSHLHHASVAVTHQATEAWRLVADLSNDTTADRSFDEERAFLTLGAIYSVGADLDLDFGIRSALNAAETDTTLLVGVALRF